MTQTYSLVTGASSGFGRSIARRMSADHQLLLAGRSSQRLEAVRSACLNPERHRLWVQDLSDLSRISGSLGELLEAEDIAIEHFIHSAGVISIQYVRALEMASVLQMFNTNLFSAMEIIRLLTQKRRNKGALRSITLISSIASRVGAKGYSAYSASKGALNACCLSLAVELAPVVRVNAVLPGIVETEMNKEHFANTEFVKFVQDTQPLGFGSPEDVATAVEFLVSESARWITGQELVVDGGRSVFAPPRAPEVA
jgi:NAD(P)-dependent dehydrogenase (short-subunit alcohol dehydrogenase family)